MRVPVRSEKEMFRLAVGVALLLGVSILLGVLVSAWLALAVFAAGLLAAAITYLRAPDPDRATPLRDASAEPHPHGAAPGRHHVLIVANDVLDGEALRTVVVGDAGLPVDVDVLAPVLTSRVHAGVSDIDRALLDARSRLERSLRWAREQGISARGAVGDPSPTTALADELRDFGADEVIVVTRPAGQESRQERGELERLRAELDVPVLQIESPATTSGAGSA